MSDNTNKTCEKVPSGQKAIETLLVEKTNREIKDGKE